MTRRQQQFPESVLCLPTNDRASSLSVYLKKDRSRTERCSLCSLYYLLQLVYEYQDKTRGTPTVSPCLVGGKLEIWLRQHFRFYLVISVQSWTN